MLFGILIHLQFGNFDVYASRLIRPAFLNGLPDDLGIILPESAFRHAVFATLSSDEFKKTAAAKKNLCGCRSNWRLEAKKSPVVPGK